MNDSDFLSTFNFELNQGDPISNWCRVAQGKIVQARVQARRVQLPKVIGLWQFFSVAGLQQDLADVLFS